MPPDPAPPPKAVTYDPKLTVPPAFPVEPFVDDVAAATPPTAAPGTVTDTVDVRSAARKFICKQAPPPPPPPPDAAVPLVCCAPPPPEPPPPQARTRTKVAPAGLVQVAFAV